MKLKYRQSVCKVILILAKKMNLKQNIKQKIISEALRNHIWIEKTNSKVELENFINRFKEKYIFSELIRISGQSDGGYLLPNNLKDISYCYSPGVSNTANFEKELSDKYNIKSFMVDGSVDKAPISDPNFQFLSKYIF